MGVKVAINGFGRIGRLVFRALHEQGKESVLLIPVVKRDVVQKRVDRTTADRGIDIGREPVGDAFEPVAQR